MNRTVFVVKKILLKVMIFSGALFFVASAYSQTPALEWAKSFGGTDGDTGASVVLDAAGNIYVTGVFRGAADFDPGPGVFTLAAGANPDVFVVKLDASGNLVWAKQFGALNDDRGFGIALDAAGNVYTTGNFQETVDFDPGAGVFNLTAEGNVDVFVSKLDNNGNFVWAKAIGGDDADRGNAILVNSSGVYVTGVFDETVDFDPGAGIFNITSKGPGSADIFILKLDAAGNFMWAKTFGGDDNADQGYSIAADPSGNVYAGGTYQLTSDFDPGAGVFNLTAVGERDVFVIKLDASGNFVWAKTMGGPEDDWLYGLALDSDDNVYSTGHFHETADFNPGAATANLTSVEDQDMFISKLDSDGNFVWAKRIGDTGDQNGQAIRTDGDDNIYVTGYFAETVDFDPGSGTFEMTAQGYNVFLVRLDPAGNFDYAVSVGANGLDIGNGMAIDAAGRIYITGYYQFTVDFDPGAGTFNMTYVGNAANPDVFLMKLGPATTGVPTITSFNPASGPIAATVVITGTNFSATPAGNSVKFNGTTAVASSSTTTSITTTVPVGATTGKITVTVGGNTATSATDFTVTTNGGNLPPIILPTVRATSAGGLVVVNLVPLISDPDNNLDLSTLSLIAFETDEGAEAEINSQSELLLDYGGVFFVGIDGIMIEVCDLAGSCTQQQLTIEVTGDLIVYNGISPNGDEYNRSWQIENIDILPDTQDNKVTVYNRWGDKVFGINGYNNTDRVFTGISDHGNELPSGTYFYRIEFPSGRASQTGYLVLKR